MSTYPPAHLFTFFNSKSEYSLCIVNIHSWLQFKPRHVLYNRFLYLPKASFLIQQRSLILIFSNGFFQNFRYFFFTVNILLYQLHHLFRGWFTCWNGDCISILHYFFTFYFSGFFNRIFLFLIRHKYSPFLYLDFCNILLENFYPLILMI